MGVNDTRDPPAPEFDEFGSPVYWITDPTDPDGQLLRLNWELTLDDQSVWHQALIDRLAELAESSSMGSAVLKEMVAVIPDNKIITDYLNSTFRTMRDLWKRLSKSDRTALMTTNKLMARKTRVSIPWVLSMIELTFYIRKQ